MHPPGFLIFPRGREAAFAHTQTLGSELCVTPTFGNSAFFWQILCLVLCKLLQAPGGSAPEEFSCWRASSCALRCEVGGESCASAQRMKRGLVLQEAYLQDRASIQQQYILLCLLSGNEHPAAAEATFKPSVGCPWISLNFFGSIIHSMQAKY